MHKHYQNQVEVTSKEGIHIDAHSLWKWNDNLQILVLVDDDEYITHRFSQDFKKAV